MRTIFTTFLFSTVLLGQSLELQNGEILVGRVTALSDRTVTVVTGYPAAHERQLERAEVAPRSWLQSAATRERVRGKLRDQYLALATNLLQRRSLDRATEWNGLACALDPEHGGCHHVQDLIVQARLTYGY